MFSIHYLNNASIDYYLAKLEVNIEKRTIMLLPGVVWCRSDSLQDRIRAVVF